MGHGRSPRGSAPIYQGRSPVPAFRGPWPRAKRRRRGSIVRRSRQPALRQSAASTNTPMRAIFDLPAWFQPPSSRNALWRSRGSPAVREGRCDAGSVNRSRSSNRAPQRPAPNFFARPYCPGGYFVSFRWSDLRCRPSSFAACDTLPPQSVSTRWICSHSTRASEGTVADGTTGTAAQMAS